MHAAILITRPRRLNCRRCAELARSGRLSAPWKFGRTGEHGNAITHPFRLASLPIRLACLPSGLKLASGAEIWPKAIPACRPRGALCGPLVRIDRCRFAAPTCIPTAIECRFLHGR
jgi:hypothetical protein